MQPAGASSRTQGPIEISYFRIVYFSDVTKFRIMLRHAHALYKEARVLALVNSIANNLNRLWTQEDYKSNMGALVSSSNR